MVGVYEDYPPEKIVNIIQMLYNDKWIGLLNTVENLEDLESSAKVDYTKSVQADDTQTSQAKSTNREHAGNTGNFIELDSTDSTGDNESKSSREDTYRERRGSTTMIQRNYNFLINHGVVQTIAGDIVNKITVQIY